MDNMSQLYNCTVARVGYIIALYFFYSSEFRIVSWIVRGQLEW